MSTASARALCGSERDEKEGAVASVHTHWDAVLVTDLGDLRDVFGRPGIRDGDGQPVGIDSRPLRVSMGVKIFVVGADGCVGDRPSDLRNGLALTAESEGSLFSQVKVGADHSSAYLLHLLGRSIFWQTVRRWPSAPELQVRPTPVPRSCSAGDDPQGQRAGHHPRRRSPVPLRRRYRSRGRSRRERPARRRQAQRRRYTSSHRRT